MNQLAHKLKLGGGSRKEIKIPTVLLGAGAQFAKALIYPYFEYRIAIYPILSDVAPKSALGLASVLGLLLEQYRSTRVYRIFSRLEGEPTDYTWSLEKSLFSPKDWTLNGLDNNINFSGKLTEDNGEWTLTLDIEDFRPPVSEESSLTVTSVNLVTLLNDLAVKISDLAREWEMKAHHTRPIFKNPDASMNDVDLTLLLENAFSWENLNFLTLWGVDSDLPDAARALLLADVPTATKPFHAWLIGALVNRILLNLENVETVALEAMLDAILDRFPDSIDLVTFVANVLTVIYDDGEASKLLESYIEKYPQEPMLRLVLAHLYLRSITTAQYAVEVYQTAILDGAVNPALYEEYSELLVRMERNPIDLRRLVLAECPERNIKVCIKYEIVAAHQFVATANPDDVRVLSKQLSYLMDVDDHDAELWEGFERLIALDKTGVYVREFIDNMDFLPDVSPAISLLETAVEEAPTRADLHVNLAAAYIADEDENAALAHLDAAKNLTQDPIVQADIDRLTLLAEDPEFQMTISEMTDIVNAGNQLDVEDMEYLEEIIERVPTFAEGYILSAKTYMAWDEYSSALEVLLDGHKHLPDDPEIVRLLGDVLWHSEEYELALDYLTNGITQNPSYVPLLATTGLYLFEDGQEDAAKICLSRAEQLASFDPVFKAVKARIAQLIIEDNN